MGKYSWSDCSEVAVMEVTPSPEIENSVSVKRRKVGNGELRVNSTKSARFTGFESGDGNQSADVTSFSSGDQPASCCSSNDSITANVNCVDLEVEIGTTLRRESSPTNKMKEVKSTEIASKSPATKTDSRRTIPKEKMPPAAEIEEFFANAEKDLQKRFKNKYNYDIVKDIPLKGRFEWEKLKP